MENIIAKLPPGSARYLDVAYVEGAKAGVNPDSIQTLDLFVPPGEGPFPLVIDMHGGGWHMGGKEEGGCGAPLALLALPRGLALASVDYRLIQDAPFPAQIEDCTRALVFLRQHAARYRLDPDRIGVSGHSAGAHLAALMATTGDGTQFTANPPVSTRVQAAACLAGPFDLDRERGSWPKEMFLWNPKDPFFAFFATRAYEAGFARWASPTSYVHSGIPPMLVISGGKDLCVPFGQAVVFADKLKQAGVDVTLVIEPEQGHSLNDSITRIQSLEFFERILNPPLPSPPGVRSGRPLPVSASIE